LIKFRDIGKTKGYGSVTDNAYALKTIQHKKKCEEESKQE